MAIINYDLVYRDGAVTGSPVTQFKLVDTLGDLSGQGKEGDLAYTKDTDYLYAHNGSVWVRTFNGGEINNDLTIRKSLPQLIIDAFSGTKGRVFTDTAARVIIGYNIYHNGTTWARDDNTKHGTMLILGPDGTSQFWVMNPAGTLSNNLYIFPDGSLIIPGSYSEYGRSAKANIWQDVPYNSGNHFTAGTGSWSVPSAYYIYKYALTGKSIKIMMQIMASTLTCSPSTVNGLCVYFPSGITANGGGVGNCTVYNGGWDSGVINWNNGNNYFTFNKTAPPGYSYLSAGDVYFLGSFEMPIN